jgi:hypothetical protein
MLLHAALYFCSMRLHAAAYTCCMLQNTRNLVGCTKYERILKATFFT